MYLATLEDGNPHKTLFERHDEVTIIKHDLFDHTDAGSVSTHSILLDGSANRKIGLAKSLMVKPGDVIDLEVYVKYFDSDAGGLTAVLNTLAANLASGASGVVVEGVNAGASSLPFADFLSGGRTSSDDPEAYLNYFVFDQNYELISSQSGFKQVGPSARETGNDVDHQKLSHSITIAKAGYVYIYLSNDDTVPFDVFFDDFKVTQHHTDIVSKDDYYPFGLTFNSYSRPAATAQNFKYNNFEYQQDLGLNLYDYLARQYDPVLGRFTSVDPLADIMRRHSPYNYAFDNPVRFTDPDGMFPEDRVDDSLRPDGSSSMKPPNEQNEGFCKECDHSESEFVETNQGFGDIESGRKMKSKKPKKKKKQSRKEAATILALETALDAMIESGISALIGGATEFVFAKAVRLIYVAKFSNLVKIGEISDDVIIFSSKFGDETVEGIANFKMAGDKLYLNGLHLEGSSAGQVGRAKMWQMAKDLGRQFKAKEVIIQGGKRTTGKYKGKIPSPFTIKVN